MAAPTFPANSLPSPSNPHVTIDELGFVFRELLKAIQSPSYVNPAARIKVDIENFTATTLPTVTTLSTLNSIKSFDNYWSGSIPHDTSTQSWTLSTRNLIS